MKSIKYIVAALMVAGLAAKSYATITVNWGAGENTFLSDNTGANNYLNGTLVEIGTFASPPTVGSPSLAGFSVFASDTTADGAFTTGSGTGTAGATFDHNQIYLVVFNAATQGASTQEFIGDVSDSTASDWKFPADTDLTPTTSIDIGQFFVGGGGNTTTLAAGAQIVYGGVGLDGSGPYSLLETVPEPSSIALVVLGLLGGVGMIRRRR